MGVKALGYVVIATAKMKEWDSFLTEVVGVMRGAGGPEGVALYRIDDRPFRFWIEPGAQDELLASAYEIADAQSWADLKAKIAAAGRPVEDGSASEAKARGVTAFFRTTDPAGNGLEFFHGDTRDDVAFVSPAGVTGFVTGEMGMGHSVLCTPNFQECYDFYKNVVGFGDTDLPRFHFSDDPDDPGMGFAFMHADNGRHHSIALAEMPVPPSRCVHLMLEMATMSDVGLCHDRMRKAKVAESATLGRHVNDQTFGFYMQTPAGFDIEIGWNPLVIDYKNWTPTAHLTPSEWGHVWAWQKAMEEQQEKAGQ
ncbi:VOC family protein [Novosphingobium sp. KACC 22771]|uniref:VOC family protein n=1 Tax=Novosphingobium sp. KACC 22771 TaxID=3025670 RepID=UPI002365C6D5|nr:VOC family protein [Novosphingobium sp. KACC 22771]WDF74297.1 VOC family protein [Novosphingobium sp. KACC 22771]